MSFERKEHYWIIVLEPSEGNPTLRSDIRLYWTSKNRRARWTVDMAQATHFETLDAARAKMASRNVEYRDPVWYRVVENDNVYVGEVETVSIVTEVVK